MGKLSKTSNSQFKQGKKSTFSAKKKGQTGLKSKNHSVHSKNKNLKKIAQNTKKDDIIEAGVKDPGKKKSGKRDMKFKKKKKDEEEEFEVAVAKDQIDEKQKQSDVSCLLHLVVITFLKLRLSLRLGNDQCTLGLIFTVI